jgi:vancomycin resistance protein YoaR
MKKYIALLTAALLLVGTACATLYTVQAKEKKEDDNGIIYSGVYLDDVYVGGLTKAQALEEYEAYIKGVENLKITFTTSVASFSTTFGDIGISISAKNAVDEAYNYGRRGNILCRYKEIKSLEKDNAILIPEKTIDEKKLAALIEEKSADIVTEPKNASISRENGEFIVVDGVVGTTVKTDETVEAVNDLLKEVWKQRDVRIAAVVEQTEPEYTAEDFEKIDSILGTKQTEYNSSYSSRAQNLATGASKISGTVLMPGEQFSVFNTVSPFTEENGYANAGQYVNDELVDGLGGGICQVSTTLFGAVLQAELQVDERYPHSLTVSYVPLGQDAAIAGDYMDFKFTNNTEYPIYIDGYAGGGYISFSIYGHETRPSNRTISFESKTVETYEPDEPEKIEDDTLEEGKEVTETPAHTGYYVELYKHVYVDGEETECTLVPHGRSKYNAARATIKVGTKKVKKKDDDEEDGDDKKKNKDEETTSEETTPAEPATDAPAENPAPGE